MLHYSISPRVDLPSMLRHRYQLNVDGNVLAYRLVNQLRSGSLTFVNSLFVNWFTDRLRPWLHYVPYDISYEDLEEKVAWAQRNDALAREIGVAAREFALREARPEDMDCYLRRLLLEYADLYRED